MALYAIGDLHLSLASNKSMEVFGEGWKDYVSRIDASLGALGPEDVLVLAGDTSWGMTLAEAEADFRFLDQFPCRKYLVKGNHDYWWTTAAKFCGFCAEKGLSTLSLLHNNCAFYGDYALCGTRGWFLEEDAHNRKVLNREVGRLEASLQAAGGREILCFLHYPPPVPGLPLPGDPGGAGEIPRPGLLLRASPRPRHPAAAGGGAGRNGLFPDFCRLSGLCPKKNLRIAKKDW